MASKPLREGQPSSTSSSTAKSASRSPTIHREASDDEAAVSPNIAELKDEGEPQSHSATFDAKTAEALQATSPETVANIDKENTANFSSASASEDKEAAASSAAEEADSKLVIFPVQPFNPKALDGKATAEPNTNAQASSPTSAKKTPYDLHQEAAALLAARKAAANAGNPPQDQGQQANVAGPARKKLPNESSAIHEAKIEVGKRGYYGRTPEITQAIQRSPVWPADYDYSASEDEAEDYDADLWRRLVRGRKRALKTILIKRVDVSWPPMFDNIEAEIDLMRIKYIFDDVDFIQAKAKREKKAFHQAFPRKDWLLETIGTLLLIVEKYKDDREPHPLDPRFKAGYMALNARTMLGGMIPSELVPRLTGGKYTFAPGSGDRQPAGGGVRGDASGRKETTRKKK